MCEGDGTGQQTDAPVARPEKKQTWTEWVMGHPAPVQPEEVTLAVDPKDWVPASNVTRLCRMVADADCKDGKEIEQITFYQVRGAALHLRDFLELIINWLDRTALQRVRLQRSEKPGAVRVHSFLSPTRASCMAQVLSAWG